MILHCTDDLLSAASSQKEVEDTHGSVVTAVQDAGLEISTSKIKEIPPWKYLGCSVILHPIRPQNIQL